MAPRRKRRESLKYRLHREGGEWTKTNFFVVGLKPFQPIQTTAGLGCQLGSDSGPGNNGTSPG